MPTREKIDISVDPKQTIHFRVARAMAICGLVMVLLLIGGAVVALGTATSYLICDIVQNYVLHIGPTVREALAENSSKEELAKKMALLENLDMLSYGVLLDPQGKPLAEWHRDGQEGKFDVRMARKIASGEMSRSGSLLYIKHYSDNKKDYSVDRKSVV